MPLPFDGFSGFVQCMNAGSKIKMMQHHWVCSVLLLLAASAYGQYGPALAGFSRPAPNLVTSTITLTATRCFTKDRFITSAVEVVNTQAITATYLSKQLLTETQQITIVTPVNDKLVVQTRGRQQPVTTTVTDVVTNFGISTVFDTATVTLTHNQRGCVFTTVTETLQQTLTRTTLNVRTQVNIKTARLTSYQTVVNTNYVDVTVTPTTTRPPVTEPATTDAGYGLQIQGQAQGFFGQGLGAQTQGQLQGFDQGLGAQTQGQLQGFDQGLGVQTQDQLQAFSGDGFGLQGQGQLQGSLGDSFGLQGQGQLQGSLGDSFGLQGQGQLQGFFSSDSQDFLGTDNQIGQGFGPGQNGQFVNQGPGQNGQFVNQGPGQNNGQFVNQGPGQNNGQFVNQGHRQNFLQDNRAY